VANAAGGTGAASAQVRGEIVEFIYPRPWERGRPQRTGLEAWPWPRMYVQASRPAAWTRRLLCRKLLRGGMEIFQRPQVSRVAQFFAWTEELSTWRLLAAGRRCLTWCWNARYERRFRQWGGWGSPCARADRPFGIDLLGPFARLLGCQRQA